MPEQSHDLLAFLWRLVEVAPDRRLLTAGERTWTRRQFLRKVAGAFADVRGLIGPIGLLIEDGPTWMATMIALEAVGETIVPLPSFFSDSQLGHAMKDAGVRVVVADRRSEERAERLAYPFRVLQTEESDPSDLPTSTHAKARQIIYTSGSTGMPKGVLLPSAALTKKAAALIEASDATSSDHVLSVLPLSLLLEQVVAVRAPILAGASVTMTTDELPAGRSSHIRSLGDLIERIEPTVIVLVPELLKQWVADLKVAGRHAPFGVRFVAVGGAPVPETLAESAWSLGIPVHEGYGLTECGSVVTLNLPGERRSGTVGRPLTGCSISIDGGEIVVTGDTVMTGYCNGVVANGAWRTGDLGALSSDGVLTVYGRRDSLIVLSNGRNVSPEWIEGLILADPAVAHCLVIGSGRSATMAVVEYSSLATSSQKIGTGWIDDLVHDVPVYARPGHIVLVEPGTFRCLGLLSPNGRVRRHHADSLVSQGMTDFARPRGGMAVQR